MQIKKNKYDSIFGFLAMVAMVAVPWYGVRAYYSGDSRDTVTLEQPSSPSLEQQTVRPTDKQSANNRSENKRSGKRKSVEDYSRSLPPKPALSGTTFEERLREYAHYCYPNGTLYHRLGLSNEGRKSPPPNARKAIFERDGHQCLLCRSHGPLQIDHMRALMNGGDNSLDNLATLCATCNKSAMKRVDNAIKKQRSKEFDRRKHDGPDSRRKNSPVRESFLIFQAISDSAEAAAAN